MKVLVVIICFLASEYASHTNETDGYDAGKKLKKNGQTLADSNKHHGKYYDSTYRLEIHEDFDERPEPTKESFALAMGKSNFHQPEGVQGTVYISMIIDSSGNLIVATIKNDPIGYGCGEEALRRIKLMTHWHPAKLKGKTVNCKYSTPIKFVLN